MLIEATLELMGSGAVAAIQDMGAAGLTSSCVEMAGKGGVGIRTFWQHQQLAYRNDLCRKRGEHLCDREGEEAAFPGR